MGVRGKGFSRPASSSVTLSPTPMEKRLVDLEVRYTHLERQIEELSEVVFEQAKRIGLLEKQLVDLRSRFRDEDEKDRGDEKPPHY